MRYLAHHLVRDSAAKYATHEALVYKQTRFRYDDLWKAVSGLGRGLRALGIERSDRVGILLEPSIPLALSIFGVSRAGAAFVPIHHSLFAEQVEHIIHDCGMKALVIDAVRFEALRPVLENCRPLERVVLVDAKKEPSPSPLQTVDFAELCAEDGSNLSDIAIDRDLAAILYTSGSTGKPKGVMLSHANVLAGAEIVADYLSISHEDRILAVLPFSFDAGLNQLTTAMLQGGTCVVMKFLFAKEIVAMLEKEKITGLAGVPPLWNLIAQDSSKLQQTSLPHLRYITNTGGALPLGTLERLRAALPQTKVFLMYGLTEAFRSTYLPPEELDRRPTSMGKAIPNCEILVLNDDGKLCAPGEPGELVHRGPTVSLGYWNQPELTDRVLRPNPLLPPGMLSDEKVCYSGDLVKTDEDGFLYFIGRRDNQIKSSGFRISPTEVEQALLKSGPLRDAAVIGLPDEMLGQSIKAFVVPQEGQSVDIEALLAGVATHLPRHMIPKCVEVDHELPKTSSGKIDYPALRRRELLKATEPSAKQS